jgi:hypothetical protein
MQIIHDRKVYKNGGFYPLEEGKDQQLKIWMLDIGPAPDSSEGGQEIDTPFWVCYFVYKPIKASKRSRIGEVDDEGEIAGSRDRATESSGTCANGTDGQLAGRERGTGGQTDEQGRRVMFVNKTTPTIMKDLVCVCMYV